ncbi:DMT family transporter [Geminicoccus roseus]|uniref:DMT family transporter n=1 Tax=Geminicoccus roseus TaxID=404900 RepID=UPI00040BEA77|nr:DMT family transporter [Geminicoccus roseus]
MNQVDGAYWGGIGRMLLVVLMWSTSGLFVRLVEDAGPFEINAGRCLVSGILLAAYLGWRHGPRWKAAFRAIPWQAHLLVVGFFVLGTPVYIFALSETSVAKVAVISATSPIFAAIFARILTGERASPGVWLAALLALGGVAALFLDDLRRSGSFNVGDLAALGVAITFSGELVALRRWHHLEMLPAAVLSNFAAVAVSLALAGGISLSLHDAGIIGLMGTVGLAIPFVLIMQGLKHVPAIQLVLVSLLDVLVSPAWVWLAVGEVPRGTTALGGIAIVAAVMMATLSGSRRPVVAASSTVPP